MSTSRAAAGRSSSDRPSAAQILDIAERLVQTRGFNGFSYADIASELGITTPAVHYHFPGKAVLGEAIMIRYSEQFAESLIRVDEECTGSLAKLEAYVDLYDGVLRNERMCLCGMLAAEYSTLPANIQTAVRRFLEDNERWLSDVLLEGRTSGELDFHGDPVEAAQLLLSGLEGAMLVARLYRDAERFQSCARQLLAGLARSC